MGVVFSSKSKKHPITLEQVDTPTPSNKVMHFGETQNHLVIPPLSARGETLDVTLGGNHHSKTTIRTGPATLETTSGKTKKVKREKKEI